MDELTVQRVHGAGVAAKDRIAMVCPAKLPPRREVVRLIADNIGLVYAGARVVARQIAVPYGIPIDILAIIDDRIISAIDVFDGADPAWIAHALHHLAWLKENLGVIAHMNGRGVGSGETAVQAAAVVARMSAPASYAAGLMKGVALDRFVVKCYTTGEDRFISLERFRGSSLADCPAEEETVDSQPRPDELKPIELSEAEIADFLGTDAGMRCTSNADGRQTGFSGGLRP